MFRFDFEYFLCTAVLFVAEVEFGVEYLASSLIFCCVWSTFGKHLWRLASVNYPFQKVNDFIHFLFELVYQLKLHNYFNWQNILPVSGTSLILLE